MKLLSGPISDLREKRLWPIAVALLVAIVAVPAVMLKSGSAARTRVAGAPSTTGINPSASALPTVSLTPGITHGRLTGHGRDPFSQRSLPVVTAGLGSVAKTTASSAGGKGSTKASTGSTSTTSSTSSTSGGSTTTPETSTTTTPATPTPTPPTTVLAAKDSYRVTAAVTDSSGGLNSIDPLQRMGLLPSKDQPLLIELGVLRGGHRVLFALTPGTVVKGPGTCTPGPIDCEILSLAPNQLEELSIATASGTTSIATVAVTGIAIDHHPSQAAAAKARQKTSAEGRALLKNLSSPALSLFSYNPGLGAIIDLRNLKVGGL